jgi:hypothetical protein
MTKKKKKKKGIVIVGREGEYIRFFEKYQNLDIYLKN